MTLNQFMYQALSGALDLHQGSVEAHIAQEVVHYSLSNGLDSIHMASMLCSRLCLDRDPLELAVRKRSIVEHLTATAVLERSMCDMLVNVAETSKVAVITRGLMSSTASILNRSLPKAIATSIPVLGRGDLVGRPDKSGLLVAAVEMMGVPLEKSGYVGDADNDEAIAGQVGTIFLRLHPFRHGQSFSS